MVKFSNKCKMFALKNFHVWFLFVRYLNGGEGGQLARCNFTKIIFDTGLQSLIWYMLVFDIEFSIRRW